MPINIESSALVRYTENSWQYAHFSSKTRSIKWKDLLSAQNQNSLLKIIQEQLSEFTNIIILPSSILLEAHSDKETIVLITKGTKLAFSETFPNLINSLWEVNELINKKGEIDYQLTEPEINKALRFIFTNKPRNLIICLNNSIFNSLHEKNLQNVLRVAGYKAITNNISF